MREGKKVLGELELSPLQGSHAPSSLFLLLLLINYLQAIAPRRYL